MFGVVRILVLGGTSFVGRAIVEEALHSGAEVTLFGRGKTGADRGRGAPPPTRGFSPEEEQTVLAQHDHETFNG